jgi:hypothetical protein
MKHYRPERGKHWLLINRKTGKVTSSSNWLVALAAVAVINQDNAGLAALLPQVKAQKLLARNKLALRVQRGGRSTPVRATLREQGKAIIPALAVLWGEHEKPPHREPRLGDFGKWIVKSLQNPQSRAYKLVVKRRYHNLLNRTSWRWWLARLEKMQS